jgi:hypothetical protein
VKKRLLLVVAAAIVAAIPTPREASPQVSLLNCAPDGGFCQPPYLPCCGGQGCGPGNICPPLW